MKNIFDIFMKKLVLSSMLSFVLTISAFSQGQFNFWNPQSRTRIGSLDGPYASINIWGQMLVGTSPNTLAPVYVPLTHASGYVGNGGTIVTVAGIGCFQAAYFQLVAWDGNRWGTDLSAVPQDQLGKTDVVGMALACELYPSYHPSFTQAAVVPVPEPSVVTLAVAGAGLLLWRRATALRSTVC